MAKSAKCDKCRIRWDIRIMDQTPLPDLKCSKCGGPVSRIYGSCDYRLMEGEPELSSRPRR